MITVTDAASGLFPYAMEQTPSAPRIQSIYKFPLKHLWIYRPIDHRQTCAKHSQPTFDKESLLLTPELAAPADLSTIDGC